MPSAPRQLALALDHAESLAREDFLGGPSNAAALALIDAWPDWPSRSVILCGPEGSGKSHLAAIWGDTAGARFLAARALDEAAVPAALATGALVIEDLAAGGFDERALFHLINLAREEEAFVLFTARSAPAGFSFAVRDLGSRLKAMPAVALAAARRCAAARGTGEALCRPPARRGRGADRLCGGADRAIVRGRAGNRGAARRGGDAPEAPVNQGPGR